MGVSSQCQDHVQSRQAIEAALADLQAKRNEFYFTLPTLLETCVRPLLQDQRDLPILYLFYNICATVLPAAVALFACPSWAKVFGPVYFVVVYALFLERFLLALHYSQHRRLFQAGSATFSCTQRQICLCQYSTARLAAVLLQTANG